MYKSLLLHLVLLFEIFVKKIVEQHSQKQSLYNYSKTYTSRGEVVVTCILMVSYYIRSNSHI